MDTALIEIVIIAFCSVVQSVFGVGLLVFGTPAMLLLGHGFEVALLKVLPAALVISIIQSIRDWDSISRFKIDFIFFCGIPLALMLSATLFGVVKLNLNYPVAAMLFFASLLPYSGWLREQAQQLLKKHSRVYLVLMGAVHGLTNLGGSMLTVYVNGTLTEKSHIRVHIAFAYTFFMIIQLGVLGIGGVLSENFSDILLLYPLIAGLIYWLVGRHLFRIAAEGVYTLCMSALMFIMAILLLR